MTERTSGRKYTIDAQRVKGIIFDFDGTMVDSEPVQHATFVRLFKEHEAQYVTFKEHLVRYGGTAGPHLYEAEVLRNNLTVSAIELRKRKHVLYWQLLEEVGIQPIKGLIPFVTTAKEHGLKLGIVSGSRRENIDRVSALAGIPTVFDYIVSGDDVVNGKPDPEGFLTAADRLGTKPPETIGIEDAYNGIQAVYNAGMKCYAIKGYTSKERQRELTKAHGVIFIENYTQLQLV